MLRFLADENFNNNIVRGLSRRQPELDIIRLRRKAEGRGQRAEGINYVFDSAFWLEPTGYKTPPSTRWIQSVGV
ncbi:MAG: hypothetical protein KME31_22635 [Tolypothrix carrinoi HA7290-LM1]|jgi:hypothetical protein|nr:hypothetical protein [Tolypothrix carrinoi HA7290-LM1]